MQVAAHVGAMPPDHSFVSTSMNNVVITAMKKAEDSNALEFHLYEWKGTDGDITVKVPTGAFAARETNLMEEPEGGDLPLKDDSVTVHVRPFEIVAFRVDYAERAKAAPLPR
jgi:alpha-mannosidase